jgi:hypothetical protein
MKKLYSCAILLSITIATSAFANGLSLQDLSDNYGPGGDSLLINDKVFHDWNINVYSYNVPAPDLSLIDVIPLTDDPLNPGIRYVANDQLSASVIGDANFFDGEGYIMLDFSYYVSTVNELPLIKDNSLELTGYDYEFENGGSGWISLYEGVYEDAGGDFITSKSVYWNQGCISNPDSCTFFDQKEFAYQSSLWVYNNLTINAEYFGPIGGSAFVSLDSWEQRFSQVPEPTTMLLLGTGLVGVAGSARRRKKNKT